MNKGQSVDKTTEAFQLMRAAGICPMPMMMHHDSQPLYSRGTNYGLLNQIRPACAKPGAVSLQVLMMTPAPGTKLYEETFNSGQVLAAAGGRPVAAYMHDGNYVVASSHRRPWQKQLNMIIGYLYFYNPVWFATNLLHCKTKVRLKPAGMQIVGMIGLLHTIRRTFGWTLRLAFRKIKRLTRRPHSNIPMHSIDGGTAAHEGGKPIPMPIPAAAQGRRVSLVVAG